MGGGNTQTPLRPIAYRERDLRMAVMHFEIEVRGRKHLADVIRRVRRLKVVHGVQRL